VVPFFEDPVPVKDPELGRVGIDCPGGSVTITVWIVEEVTVTVFQIVVS
jgi:hypothetical protein